MVLVLPLVLRWRGKAGSHFPGTRTCAQVGLPPFSSPLTLSGVGNTCASFTVLGVSEWSEQEAVSPQMDHSVDLEHMHKDFPSLSSLVQ